MLLSIRKLSLIITGVSLLWFASCKKERSCEGCANGNKPPVAIAGQDRMINLPIDTVLLDGSASNDPDGSITTWNWTKLSGPNSIMPVTSTPKITIKNLSAGIYQFELTVTDNGGLSGKDTVQVSVSGSTNRPPIANAGPDQTTVLPDNSVAVNGSATIDPDNNIISYLWVKLSGPAANITNPNAVQTSITGLSLGAYQFELTVTDAGGLFSKDTVVINVINDPATTCINNNRPEVNAQLVPFATLSNARNFVSVATAANKIVFASGYQNAGSYLSSVVDIYDLVTQSWTTASFHTAHPQSAVVVSNNKIFFAGGGNYYDIYYSNIDIYDAVSNSWSTSNLSVPKREVAGAAVGNKIIFAGGHRWDFDRTPPEYDGLAEINDVSAGNWSNNSLSEARTNITSATIGDKAYFAGGYGYFGKSKKIDIYDNATNTWSTSELTFLTTAYTAIAVGNNIYWTEGCQVEIRDVSTGISRLDHLSRPGSSISVVKDDNIVFIRHGSRYFDIYNTTTSQWSVGILPTELLFGAAVISVNNTIYIAGGTTHCAPSGNGSCTPIFTNQVWKLVF